MKVVAALERLQGKGSFVLAVENARSQRPGARPRAALPESPMAYLTLRRAWWPPQMRFGFLIMDIAFLPFDAPSIVTQQPAFVSKSKESTPPRISTFLGPAPHPGYRASRAPRRTSRAPRVRRAHVARSRRAEELYLGRLGA